MQRGLAAQIMDLFGDGESPERILAGQQNVARRQLYLLALRLERRTAYDACMRFIACASTPDADGPEALERWEQMMDEVSRIYTGRTKKSRS